MLRRKEDHISASANDEIDCDDDEMTPAAVTDETQPAAIGETTMSVAHNSSHSNNDGDSSFAEKLRSNVSNMISKLFASRPVKEKSRLSVDQQYASSYADNLAEPRDPSDERKRKHSMIAVPSRAEKLSSDSIELHAKKRRVSTDDKGPGSQVSPFHRNIRSKGPIPGSFQKHVNQRRALRGGYQPLPHQSMASSKPRRYERHHNQRPNKSQLNITSVFGCSEPAITGIFRNNPYRSMQNVSSPREGSSERSEQGTTSRQSEPVHDGAKFGVESRTPDTGDVNLPRQFTPLDEERMKRKTNIFGSKLSLASTSSVSDSYRELTGFPQLSYADRRTTSFLGNSYFRKRQLGGSSNELFFSSHLDPNKDLFSSKASSSNASSERPSFNYSAYSSTSSLNSRRPLCSSPFYDGVTRYGGASAARTYMSAGFEHRLSLNEPLAGRITKVTVPEVKSSGKQNATSEENGPTLSYTSQRILDIIERYSSTKKAGLLPPANVMSEELLGVLDSDTRKPVQSRKLANTSHAYRTLPYGELHIPRVPQMLQILRMQKTTENARKIAQQDSTSILAEPVEYVPPKPVDKPPPTGEYALPEHVGGFGGERGAGGLGKQITKKTRLHEEPVKDKHEPALPFDLPNVQLPALASVPKFDLGLAFKPPTTKPVETRQRKDPETVLLNGVTSENEVENDTTTVDCNGELCFTFSSPSPLGFCEDCEPLEEPVTFVDVEILSLEDATDGRPPVWGGNSTPIDPFQALKNASASSWECEMCLIRNDMTKSTCAACESPRPADGASVAPVPVQSQPATSIPVVDATFDAIVTAQCSQWTCPCCCVSNDQAAQHCVCCETSKPASQQPSKDAPKADAGWLQSVALEQTNPNGANDAQKRQSPVMDAGFQPPAQSNSSWMQTGSFQSIVANQNASTWSCDTCLAQNERSAVTCACCGTEQPGVGGKGSTPASTPFAQSSSAGFSPTKKDQSPVCQDAVHAVNDISTLSRPVATNAHEPVVQLADQNVPQIHRDDPAPANRQTRLSPNVLPPAGDTTMMNLSDSVLVAGDSPMDVSGDISMSRYTGNVKSSAVNLFDNVQQPTGSPFAFPNTFTSPQTVPATPANGKDLVNSSSVPFAFGNVQVPSTSSTASFGTAQQVVSGGFPSAPPEGSVQFVPFSPSSASVPSASTMSPFGDGNFMPQMPPAGVGVFGSGANFKPPSDGNLFVFGAGAGRRQDETNNVPNAFHSFGNNNAENKPFSFTPNAVPMFNFTSNAPAANNVPVPAQSSAPVFQFGGQSQQAKSAGPMEFINPAQAPQQFPRRLKLRGVRRLQPR